jgi:hypothetical protein
MTIKRTEDQKLAAAQEGWAYATEWASPLAEEKKANAQAKPEDQSSKIANDYVRGKKFKPDGTNTNPLAIYYHAGITSGERGLSKPTSYAGLTSYLRGQGSK